MRDESVLFSDQSMYDFQAFQVSQAGPVVSFLSEAPPMTRLAPEIQKGACDILFQMQTKALTLTD